MTGNIPRKSSAQRANLRAKKNVRRYGDHAAQVKVKS